jgi:hypothetical protein
MKLRSVNKKSDSMRKLINKNGLIKIICVGIVALIFAGGAVLFSSCEKKTLGKNDQERKPADTQMSAGGDWGYVIDDKDGNGMRDSSIVKEDINRLEIDSMVNKPRFVYTGGRFTTMDSALYGIAPGYWTYFEMFPTPLTFIDTVKMYIKTIDTIWNIYSHGTPNEAPLQELYKLCNWMIKTCDSLVILRDELEEIRQKGQGNVRIPTYGALRNVGAIGGKTNAAFAQIQTIGINSRMNYKQWNAERFL